MKRRGLSEIKSCEEQLTKRWHACGQTRTLVGRSDSLMYSSLH